jgi:hypothetical protein
MIDKNDLLKWLSEIDIKLNKKIVLIAVGGTAMTLLGLKPSTRDVDFCLDSEDRKDFENVLDKKFIVDLFVDGYIFSEQLPSDYAEMSKDLVKMKNITLKTLSPVDIVITKAARLNARDEEDINSISKHVDKKLLVKRFKQVVETYAGNENDFRYHFELVLKRYFS